MSQGSSGSKPDEGQPAQERRVPSSSRFGQALGDEWLEVAPGIFRQIARDDPAPQVRLAANAEARSLEQRVREALAALTVDLTEAETASAVEPARSNEPRV